MIDPEVLSTTPSYLPFINPENNTGLLLDQFSDSLFKKTMFVWMARSKETDAATVDYCNEGTESSTSQQADSSELAKKAIALFVSAKEQIFEDGMKSNFSEGLVEFITTYGRTAMDIIIRQILSDQVNYEVVSEALRVIGRIYHPATYRERLWLLEKGLYSASARVRDGACVGLAYLDDPIAIEPLKFAVDREPIPELRKYIEQVLSQLEDTQNGVRLKKDQNESMV